MNLQAHYNQLYESAIKKIKSNNYQRDFLIDSPDDKRFGVTLLVRPSENIKNKIQFLLDDLKQIDPIQYYYPSTDIHITIMSIISCYEGFRLDQISTSEYIELISSNLKEIDKFNITFKGITASDSSVMIQGFPTDENLNNLRNGLRNSFRSSNLKQSIDIRYTIQTAHSTVVRFREKLIRINEVLEVLDYYKDYEFGTFEVNELELVFNDWYQRKNNSKLIKKFHL